MILTGEQRYRQCMRKADLLWQRSRRQHEPEGWSGPCLMEFQDRCITEEFDRQRREIEQLANELKT